jgi:hypothetical protein
MGVTSDLIEFTGIPKNCLAFVQLTTTQPIFSRPDIGLLTVLITRLKYILAYRNRNKETHVKYDFRYNNNPSFLHILIV